jgi:DNA-damage-inducible protein D
MHDNNLLNQHHKAFEEIRQYTKENQEFWSARDLARVLQYSEYRHFLPVIEKAKRACKNSGKSYKDHFENMLEMVKIGSGAKRNTENYRLSRYACYLVIQNADPSKEIVANGQTYFAIQTRRQEMADSEMFQQLDEDKKRILLRYELKEHNKQLVETANQAGVESQIDFAIFQNHGYKGLYGGLDAKGIHQKKGLTRNQQILDHMGSTELAANLFRATQTEEKLRRDEIHSKQKANKTHFDVGKKVRQTIADLGSTMPENLPTPKISIKILEKKPTNKIIQKEEERNE